MLLIPPSKIYFFHNQKKKNMKKLLLSAGILLSVIMIGCSPSVNLVQGDPATIKGQEVIDVRFTYNDLLIGNTPEADYVERKKSEAHERDGDGGERWHKAWLDDRTNKYEPTFINYLNRYTNEFGVRVIPGEHRSKHIMLVNTYFTEPGFNVGISSKAAVVRLKISFVERNNPDNIVAEFNIPRAVGNAAPFDMGSRIEVAYRSAAILFGRKMRSVLN